MTQQRLAELLAEFRIAHATYAAHFPGDDGDDYLNPAYVATWKTEEYEVNPCPDELAMIAAARRYIIAREQSLAELLAEFEASVAKVKLAYMPKALNHPHDEIVPIELMSFTYLWENADGFIVSYEEADDIGLCQTRMFYQDWKFIRETYEAAKLYCIARDEGISAAVMWKLANGGAQ